MPSEQSNFTICLIPTYCRMLANLRMHTTRAAFRVLAPAARLLPKRQLHAEHIHAVGEPTALTVRDASVRQRSRCVAAARKSSALQQLEELSREEGLDREDARLPLAEELHWTSPLDVLQYPDPRLRAQNARVGVFGKELQRLTDEMFEMMYSDDGVGLAAPQVGVNVRLMVFNGSGERGQGEELVLANPRILHTGGGLDTMEEGCLSFFKLGSKDLILADVQRNLRIKVEAQDVNGQKFQRSFTDWTARVFQHEFDHLQGTLFPDRVSTKERRKILPDLQQLEDHYLQQNPDARFRRYK